MDWQTTNVGSIWWRQYDKQSGGLQDTDTCLGLVGTAHWRMYLTLYSWKADLDQTVPVFFLPENAGFWKCICIADTYWTCAKEDFKLTWVGRQPSQRSGRVSSGGLHDKWLSCRNLANCFPVSAAQWIVNDQASQDHFHFLYLYCYLQIWISEECSRQVLSEYTT